MKAFAHSLPAPKISALALEKDELCNGGDVSSVQNLLRNGCRTHGVTSPACIAARNRCFCSLPAAVRGRPATIFTDRGTLKRASRELQCALIVSTSSEDPDSSTTNAAPVSPHFASGTPMTATSLMPSNSAIAASTSAGYTFSPPDINMSLM